MFSSKPYKTAVSFTMPDKMAEAVQEDIKLTIAYRGVLESEAFKRQSEGNRSQSQADLTLQQARELKIKNDFDEGNKSKKTFSHSFVFWLGLLMAATMVFLIGKGLYHNFSASTIKDNFPAILVLIAGIGFMRAESLRDSVIEIIKSVKW